MSEREHTSSIAISDRAAESDAPRGTAGRIGRRWGSATPGTRVLLTLALAGLASGCAAVEQEKAAQAPRPNLNLAGTDWQIEDIAGAAVIDKAQTALRFERDGRVSGTSGCNSFTGSVTITGEALTFSPLATTRRACQPELMKQEQNLLSALGAVRSFALDDGGHLRLLDANGSHVLRFARAGP